MRAHRVDAPGAGALAIALLLTWVATAPAALAEPEHPAGLANIEEIEVFTRAGCPRCAAARAFLDQLLTERADVRVVYRAVDEDRAARERLEHLVADADVGAASVPTFLIRGRLLVGFDDAATTGAQVRALLDGAAPMAPADTMANPTCTPAAGPGCKEAAGATGEDVRTRFGTLSATRLGLVLFTIALGLVDGFNPCAMWVLLFLLSMLVNLRDRRRMAAVAGTFVLVSGLAYFAFMAAWLNVFLLLGWSRAVQVILGVVALVIGLVNMKDFVAFKRGVSLSIPEGAKPSIYRRVRAVLRAPTLTVSLVGVAALAVLVNMVELLCTAGLPAVYTAVLAERNLSAAERYAYLGLYNLAYLADDALMVTVAVATLAKTKLTERGGRWLKLVSGVVMTALALGLLLFPEWLR